MRVYREQKQLIHLYPPDSASGKRFLRRFAQICAICLLLVATFNWLVDPYRIFESPIAIKGRHVNVRGAKIDLLKKMRPLPQVLILGTSRANILDPQGFEKWFGRITYNASVNGGNVEDWLALTRYCIEGLNCDLKVIVIGIGYDTMYDPVTVGRHPAHFAELRRYLESPWSAWLFSKKYLLSEEITLASVGVLKRRFSEMLGSGRAAHADGREERKFRKDGFLLKRKTKKLKSKERAEQKTNFRRSDDGDNGNRNQVLARIEEIHAEKREMIEENKERISALIQLARRRNIDIVFFIHRDRPRFVKKFNPAAFAEHAKETEAFLGELQAEGVVYCPLDDSVFNFRNYFDPIHPGVDSGQRIADALFACWKNMRTRF